MNLILGSGMSGLTTAYTLDIKNKKSKLINTSLNFKNNNKLLKHLFYQNANELNESFEISRDKVVCKDCNITFSYSNGGLANAWGGAISDIESYDFSKYPVKKKNFLKYEQMLDDIFSIISNSQINIKNKIKKNIYENFIGYNFFQIKKNVKFLEKYLYQKKNIEFLNNRFVKKINFKENNVELYNFKSQSKEIVDYSNLFLSCGSVGTPMLLIKSNKEIYDRVKLHETQHFSGFATLKKNIHRSFKINLKHQKAYIQFYDLNFIFNYLFGFNFTFLNKFNFYYIQLYLSQSASSKIELTHNQNNFVFQGKKNYDLNFNFIDSLKKDINKSQDHFKLHKLIKSGIGSSNHIGCSFPMNDQDTPYSTNKYGKLKMTDNVYICDNSSLSEIDTQPISSLNMLNIVRMIMENDNL